MRGQKDAYDPNAAIDKEMFKQLMQLKTDYMAERLFYVMKEEGKGDTMSFQHLRKKVRELNFATFTFKLYFLFRLFDVNNSGVISRSHLHNLLHSSVQESTMWLAEDDVSRLSDELFDDVSDDVSGSVTWEEWSRFFLRFPHLIDNFALRVPTMLDSPELTKTGGCHFSLPRHLTLTYFHNNRVKVIFTLTFIFLNLAAGALNAWLYRDHNWFLIVARLAGMGLNVSCCVAMGLTLRKTLTLLHRPPLAAWLPLDHHVLFHKMAGYCIVFLSLVHTLSHVANAAIYLSPSVHLNLAQCLFTLRAEVGWVAGFAPLSGVVLFLLILLLFLSSMEYVRKWSCFEVFYWTHKLSLPIVLLAVLHATHFWKWIIAPFLLYCLEQGLKLTGICTQCSVRGHQPHIHGVSLFPSGVAELKITRPRGFDFHAGDYIFLNIPAIARYEWHPFTISSAPQNKDTMTLHIRSAGHWTRRLYSYFEDRTCSLPATLQNVQTTEPTFPILYHMEERQKRNDSQTALIYSDTRQGTVAGGCVNYACTVLEQDGAEVRNQREKLGVERMGVLEREQTDSVNTVSSVKQERINRPSVNTSVTSVNQVRIDRSAVDFVSDLENGQTGRQAVKICTHQAQEQTDGHVVMVSRDIMPQKQEDGQAMQIPRDVEDGKAESAHKVRVYMDGPYGTPSRHILQAEHAILIGSGIGVTPFASVMQSMVCHRRQKGGKSTVSSPSCFSQRSTKTLKKVDFVWLNRDLHSFDWLLPALTELERSQSRDDGPGHVIDMQMYLTSAPTREDLRGVGLQAAVDAVFRRQGRDFFTGLTTTPTRLGRPNFDEIFKDIALKAKGKIQVFFCGSPALRNTVKTACELHGFHFCREHF